MLNARNILSYFIEYEKKTILMENSLAKVDGDLISDERLGDNAYLEGFINRKKVEGILNKIIGYKDVENNIKHKKYSRNELRAHSEKMVAEQMTISEFLEKVSFKYPDNKKNTEEFIQNLVTDKISICYPLLKKKTNKEEAIKPVLSFLCRLEDKKLIVEHFFVNRESLEIIIAALTECSTVEVAELEKRNLQELLNANEYNQQKNLFDILDIFQMEMMDRYGKGYQQFITHEGWQKLNQAFVTFETLEEIKRPIFQKEIQRILDLTKQTEELPPLLQTYLIGGQITEEYCKVNAGKSFHYGSYTGQYPVNEKQWHIIETLQQHNLLSVNGPPGTGKSTLLKEIFADNFVKKARMLTRIWEQPWEGFKDRSCDLYRIPLGSNERTYSMALTSTNNKAVDNIGVELLKEVAYFSQYVSEEQEKEGYKGFFCARLGNSRNREEFVNHFVPMFLKGLEAKEEKDKEVEVLMQFTTAYEELENIHSDIERFIKSRADVLDFYREHEIELVNATVDKTKMIATLKELNIEGSELEKSMYSVDQTVTAIEQNIQQHIEYLSSIEHQFSDFEVQIKHGYHILEQYRTWKKSGWFGWIFPKRRAFFKEYSSESYIENRLIKKIEENQDELKKKKEIRINDLALQQSTLQEKYEQQKKLGRDRLEIDRKIMFFNRAIQILDCYLTESLRLYEKWGLEGALQKSRFDFSKETILLEKRHRLFLFSLQVIEKYVSRHAREITHNLRLATEENWFKPFFNEGNKRDFQYAKGIRALWDTIFLCFPIVTSTLHSFGERTFHLLPNLIDTLLVDEAGQIMPHYLSGPLFRSKRAIIVGDIEQLEPVRVLKSNVIENTVLIPEEYHDTICVQNNSAQSYVDRNSDVYEWDYQEKKKGMILTEHRRCEESIMLFSNRYVYGNILTIVNKDRSDKLFGSNLLAVDVRGLKDSKTHSNQSEVDICRKMVDHYVQEYGVEIKKHIGIITPFNKQKEMLQAAINGVDIGTVHTFQGQEKKIILFSTVVDGEDYKIRGLSNFIGGKTNLLNVALSRAKEQFVLIGNLEVISKLKHNSLEHVFRIIKEKGSVISPFNEEFHCIESSWEMKAYKLYTTPSIKPKREESLFSVYIQNHIPEHLILTPQEHYRVLMEAIRHATKSIVIFSPWIMDYVVNEEFIELVQKAIQRKINLRIGFGYKGGKGIDLHQVKEIVTKDYAFGNKPKIETSITRLRDVMGASLQYVPPIHSKILLVDDQFLFIGSHNWLAKVGKIKRDEVSCLITDSRMIEYLKERYIQIKLS
jgi:AAA domain/PLD-like domain